MESILEMIQGVITKFLGGSAMAVIQEFIDKIIGLIGSIFGSLKPATS
jgi:phage-related protein